MFKHINLVKHTSNKNVDVSKTKVIHIVFMGKKKAAIKAICNTKSNEIN